MAKEMIRIRLKAYDHQVIDQSAEKIVETSSGSPSAPEASRNAFAFSFSTKLIGCCARL